MAKEVRVNERIRAREVRLIGENGEQLGIVPLHQALQMARERNVDLVEVAPTAVPPVCRVLDYGKFKYEQTKREREARKHTKVVELKEIRIRPKIDDHDIDFKTRMAQRFLAEGDKVKVTVVFRGREVTHPQIGRQLLEQMMGQLKAVALIEKPPSMEGHNMTLIMAPGAVKPPRESGARETPPKESPPIPGAAPPGAPAEEAP